MCPLSFPNTVKAVESAVGSFPSPLPPHNTTSEQTARALTATTMAPASEQTARAPEIDIDGIEPEEPEGISWLLLVKIAVGILSVLVPAFFLLGRTAVIRPEKPQFTLQDITLYDFNVSVDPSLLSSRFQVTVSSHNPNARIGIYYDSLVGYAAYCNQQVTSRTDIPATYQGHENSDVWSVSISGTSVPVAPYIGVALSRDWSSDQMAAIVIELEGQVRWKLGILANGKYHITVRCPAYITTRAYFSTVISARNQLFQRCDVDFSK